MKHATRRLSRSLALFALCAAPLLAEVRAQHGGPTAPKGGAGTSVQDATNGSCTLYQNGSVIAAICTANETAIPADTKTLNPNTTMLYTWVDMKTCPAAKPKWSKNTKGMEPHFPSLINTAGIIGCDLRERTAGTPYRF